MVSQPESHGSAGSVSTQYQAVILSALKPPIRSQLITALMSQDFSRAVTRGLVPEKAGNSCGSSDAVEFTLSGGRKFSDDVHGTKSGSDLLIVIGCDFPRVQVYRPNVSAVGIEKAILSPVER